MQGPQPVSRTHFFLSANFSLLREDANRGPAKCLSHVSTVGTDDLPSKSVRKREKTVTKRQLFLAQSNDLSLYLSMTLLGKE